MRDQEIIGLWEAYKQVHSQPQEEVENVDEGKRPFPFKKVAAQQEKARKGSVYGKDTGNEPSPKVSDKEKKETGRFSKMHQASEKAKREKQVADKARRSSTFYKDTHPASAPKMKKANEEVEIDLFDYLLEYLVAEGYADTNKAALAIMANMSEEWKQSICEAEGLVGVPKRSWDPLNIRQTMLDRMRAGDYPAGSPIPTTKSGKVIPRGMDPSKVADAGTTSNNQPTAKVKTSRYIPGDDRMPGQPARPTTVPGR